MEKCRKISLQEETTLILIAGGDGFNRILAYRSFLRTPKQDVDKKFLAGALKVDERLIHYLIVWILCPYGSNHGQCIYDHLLNVKPYNH